MYLRSPPGYYFLAVDKKLAELEILDVEIHHSAVNLWGLWIPHRFHRWYSVFTTLWSGFNFFFSGASGSWIADPAQWSPIWLLKASTTWILAIRPWQKSSSMANIIGVRHCSFVIETCIPVKCKHEVFACSYINSQLLASHRSHWQNHTFLLGGYHVKLQFIFIKMKQGYARVQDAQIANNSIQRINQKSASKIKIY